MAEQTMVQTRTIDGVEVPAPGTYVLDPMHTRIGFAARHMAVSKVRGGFNKFEGTIEVGENPADSKVSVTIDASSVDTREEARDQHLRTNDFFDVATHPTWSFESTGVRPAGPGVWDVDGDLTIRGVTRPATLHTVLEGVVQDPYGNHRVGFTATTSVDRNDFGISFNAVLDKGGLVVGNKVDIEIEAEATLQV